MQLRLTQSGRFMTRGAQIGEGGEGIVFLLKEDSSMLFKAFKAPSPERFQKLELMLRHKLVDPTAHQNHCTIAWPTDIVEDCRGNKLGFVMPRVQGGTPFRDVYFAASRQTKLPDFTYRHLVRTAHNLCSAIDAIHVGGFVIADLNDENVLVQPNTLISIIDCDSFQVNSHYCPVGKTEYLPPEYQGKDLSRISRSANNDHHSLAVMLYLLLMEGCHPFAGLGDPGSLGERIVRGMFAYSQRSSGPPPSALALSTLTQNLVGSFSKAFDDGFFSPDCRPSALQWKALLAPAENDLVSCPANAKHIYFNHLKVCPWCEREQRTNLNRALNKKTGRHRQASPKRRTQLRPQGKNGRPVARNQTPTSPVYHTSPVYTAPPSYSPSPNAPQPQAPKPSFWQILGIIGAIILTFWFFPPPILENLRSTDRPPPKTQTPATIKGPATPSVAIQASPPRKVANTGQMARSSAAGLYHQFFPEDLGKDSSPRSTLASEDHLPKTLSPTKEQGTGSALYRQFLGEP